jgi:hypothetical protein
VSSSRTPAPGTQISGSIAIVMPAFSSMVSAPRSASPTYGGSLAPMPIPCPMKSDRKSPPRPRSAPSERTAAATSSFVKPGRIIRTAACSPW